MPLSQDELEEEIPKKPSKKVSTPSKKESTEESEKPKVEKKKPEPCTLGGFFNGFGDQHLIHLTTLVAMFAVCL